MVVSHRSLVPGTVRPVLRERLRAQDEHVESLRTGLREVVQDADVVLPPQGLWDRFCELLSFIFAYDTSTTYISGWHSKERKQMNIKREWEL